MKDIDHDGPEMQEAARQNEREAFALNWETCEHKWKEVEAQDLSETFGSVECEKCGCPGEMTWATKEVFWPAT